MFTSGLQFTENLQMLKCFPSIFLIFSINFTQTVAEGEIFMLITNPTKTPKPTMNQCCWRAPCVSKACLIPLCHRAPLCSIKNTSVSHTNVPPLQWTQAVVYFGYSAFTFLQLKNVGKIKCGIAHSWRSSPTNSLYALFLMCWIVLGSY